VKNQGAVAAPATWSDSVYVSGNATFDSSAVKIATFDESGHSGLAAGASYTDAETITVGQFAVGSQYLLFVTDYSGYYGAEQPQSDRGTSPPDANDVKAVHVVLAAPDLRLAAATGPASAVVGNAASFAVSY